MKINYRTNFWKFLILVFAIGFTQCMQDEYDFDKLSTEMEINGGIITPIAYGSLSIDDLISKLDSSSSEFLNEYEDGLLFITYEDSIGSFTASDLISMPDQDFFEYFIESDDDFPTNPWLASDTMSVERTEFFEMTFENNERLDSIILDAANLHIESSSTFLHEGQIKITCPTIKKNGISFSDSIQISSSDGSFSNISDFALDGYTVELNNSIDPDTSFIQVDFVFELYNSGNPINAGDRVNISATINNIDFSSAYGYIGNYELAGEEGNIELGFFDDFTDGDFEFENPQININISNSYGFPVEANITNFKGYTETDSVELTFLPGVNPFKIAYPKLAEFGETKDTVISINSDNSNIGEFLALFPSEINYNISALSNPDGPGTSYNFVKDDSRLDLDLEVILPLWFKANIMAFEDTTDFDLSDETDKIDMINKLSVLLVVDNGIPFEINIQGTLTDSLYNEINTLFDPSSLPVIDCAVVGADGKVREATSKKSTISYDKSAIDELKDVKYLIITARIKTSDYSNNTMVKFYNNYSIDFNLGLDIDYSLNPDNL